VTPGGTASFAAEIYVKTAVIAITAVQVHVRYAGITALNAAARTCVTRATAVWIADITVTRAALNAVINYSSIPMILMK